MQMKFAIHVFTLLTVLAWTPLRAQDSRTEAKPAEESQTPKFRPLPSPDGRWQHCLLTQPGEDGEEPSLEPAIVKAGTKEVALKLETPWPGSSPERESVRWAPDSRRLAYSYQSGGRYRTAELYQLRAGKWVTLRSPEAPETTLPLTRAQDAQARKLGVPKDVSRQRRDVDWTIRRWVNADTAELYVYSTYAVEVPKTGISETLEAEFLFTLRFDTGGRWTVIRMHAMTANKLSGGQLRTRRVNNPNHRVAGF